MSILLAIKEDDYRIGNCQAIVYDRKLTKPFPVGFLSGLYFKFRGNRYSDGDGDGILEVLFCGMADLSHDAIVDYWLHHPLVVLGVWHDDEFKVAGICFPSMMIGSGEPERACYAGYGFIREFWGTDEQEVLAVLGISALFVEIGILSLHGTRYADNDLTSGFMKRFGFVDVATLPRQMVRRGKLVEAIISTLPRQVFEAHVEKMLLGNLGQNL